MNFIRWILRTIVVALLAFTAIYFIEKQCGISMSNLEEFGVYLLTNYVAKEIIFAKGAG